MRDLLLTAALMLTPLTALASCLGAARALPRRLGRPWVLLGVSAAVAAFGVIQLRLGGNATDTLNAVLNVAPLALFAVALSWILQQRDRRSFLEIALDAALVIAAVTVATLVWSPAARQILEQQGFSGDVSPIGVFGAPVAAGCAVLFAFVLLLVRGKSAGPVPLLLAIAALGLTLGIAPLALGAVELGAIAWLAFATGWAGVAAAGALARRRGSRAFRPSRGDAGQTRLRTIVAPAVGLIMGAVAIDIAWRNDLRQATGIALGALGMILALRVTQLLAASRSFSSERAELHQSRALIELSHALSAATNLQETLDLLTRWAVKLLDGHGAAIELLTPDGLSLEFKAIHGLPEELLRLRLPLDGSFSGWVVQHSRPRASADPHTDPYINATGLRYIGHLPVAAAPLRYRDRTLGALLCTGHYPFDEAEVELLGALADQAAVAIENARLFDEVHQLSLTDPLTGLPNRRQLEHDLTREFAAARRGRRLVAIMFDLNGFKQYNDRYGHLAGDEALRLFASALAAETRTMNMAARYGGDEFIALLADADRAGASVFLERVRSRFPGSHASGRERELSVAAGMAEFDPTMTTPQQLIAAADAALYEEKLQLATHRHRSAS